MHGARTASSGEEEANTMSLIEDRLREAAQEGSIGCAKLFEIAAELGETPALIGAEASRIELRVVHCQLGAFGYDDFGERRLLHPLSEVPDLVAKALSKGVIDGKLSCAVAWRIARGFALPRLVIGCAAETEGLRIGPCQLGCF